MQDNSKVFCSPVKQYFDTLVQIYGNDGVGDKEDWDQPDEEANQCVLRFLQEHNAPNALEPEHRIYFTEIGYMIGSFHRIGALHGNLGDVRGIWFNSKQEHWHHVIIQHGVFNAKILNEEPTNEQCVDDLIPFIRNYGDLPFIYFCWGYVRALGRKGAESAELAYDLCAHLG
jgi:hypothetical protein